MAGHDFIAEYHDLEKQLADPSIHTDVARSRKVGRRYSELTPIVKALTEREREVVQLILAGKSNKEIAASMCIGESTVKFHVSNVYAKHDVGSRAELICTLLRNRTEA